MPGCVACAHRLPRMLSLTLANRHCISHLSPKPFHHPTARPPKAEPASWLMGPPRSTPWSSELTRNSQAQNHRSRSLWTICSAAGQRSFSAAAASRDYPTHARVGIGIVVFRRSPARPTDTQVLMIKRGREPSKGMWSFPGGGLELGETMVECAVREVLEETGIAIRNESPPGLRSVWSSTLSFPTAFAAADLIEHGTGTDQSRIKYHYCIVELAALAQDPAQEPMPGDDAEAAMWLNVHELSELQGLTEGCDQLTQEAVRIFNVPGLLQGPDHATQP